jgi:hypothetical protein
MAVPANNAKITMTFALSTPAGAEDEAEVGLWGFFQAGAPADYDATLLGLAEAARDKWVADIPKSDFSQAAELKTVSAIHYDATGHTANEQRAVTTTGDWIGSQIRGLPWETSLVISLYTYTPGTFIANARRRRGRCYLPPLGASVLANNGSGFLPDADALNILTAFEAFLTDVRGVALAGGVNWAPGVFSREDGAIRVLTDLGVDGKIDSQRRRQKSEIPVRQYLPYTP